MKKRRLVTILLVYVVLIFIPIIIYVYFPDILSTELKSKLDKIFRLQRPEYSYTNQSLVTFLEQEKQKNKENKYEILVKSLGEWEIKDIIGEDGTLLAKAKVLKVIDSNNNTLNLIINIYSLEDTELNKNLSEIIGKVDISQLSTKDSQWNVVLMRKEDIDRASDPDTFMYDMYTKTNYYFSEEVNSNDYYYIFSLATKTL